MNARLGSAPNTRYVNQQEFEYGLSMLQPVPDQLEREDAPPPAAPQGVENVCKYFPAGVDEVFAHQLEKLVPPEGQGVSRPELHALFSALDANSDGVLTRAECVADGQNSDNDMWEAMAAECGAADNKAPFSSLS